MQKQINKHVNLFLLPCLALWTGCTLAAQKIETQGKKDSVDAIGNGVLNQERSLAQGTTTQIDTIKTELTASELSLETIKNQVAILTTDLLGFGFNHCITKKPLSQIRIKISGRHLENGVRIGTGEFKGYPLNEGNSKLIQLTLGDNLVFTNSNEAQQNLFSSNGLLSDTNHGHLKIGDIQSFKIQKKGLAYDHEKRSWPGGWFGIGAGAEWIYWEIDRYLLESVSIIVNSQNSEYVVYAKNGINFTFEGKNQEWTDPDFNDNAQRVTTLTSQACVR